MRKLKLSMAAAAISIALTACASGSGASPTTTTTTTTTTTDSRVGLCQFKQNGKQTCTNKATHGSLCDYHFNLLNDTYNDLVGD